MVSVSSSVSVNLWGTPHSPMTMTMTMTTKVTIKLYLVVGMDVAVASCYSSCCRLLACDVGKMQVHARKCTPYLQLQYCMYIHTYFAFLSSWPACAVLPRVREPDLIWWCSKEAHAMITITIQYIHTLHTLYSKLNPIPIAFLY